MRCKDRLDEPNETARVIVVALRTMTVPMATVRMRMAIPAVRMRMLMTLPRDEAAAHDHSPNPISPTPGYRTVPAYLRNYIVLAWEGLESPISRHTKNPVYTLVRRR